jgi:hypothetical protein
MPVCLLSLLAGCSQTDYMADACNVIRVTSGAMSLHHISYNIPADVEQC